MSITENKELIQRWYEALADGDFETIFDMHHDDVVYNMLGNTPVSGRIYGKDACCNGMIGQKLLEKLITEKIKFSKERPIKPLYPKPLPIKEGCPSAKMMSLRVKS